MSRRRAPRIRWQQLSDAIRAEGTAGAGFLYNASPILARNTPRSSGAVIVDGTDQDSQIDTFTLAGDGPQDLALTYVPVQDSWNVDVNGITALSGTGYTISGQTLSLLLTPPDAIAGDEVQIQYDYLTASPTVLTDAYAYPSNDCGVYDIEYTVTTHPEDQTLVTGYEVRLTFDTAVDPSSPLYDVRALFLFQDSSTNYGNLYNNWQQESTTPNVWSTGDVYGQRFGTPVDLTNPIVSFRVHNDTPETCEGLPGTRVVSFP